MRESIRASCCSSSSSQSVVSQSVSSREGEVARASIPSIYRRVGCIFFVELSFLLLLLFCVWLFFVSFIIHDDKVTNIKYQKKKHETNESKGKEIEAMRCRNCCVLGSVLYIRRRRRQRRPSIRRQFFGELWAIRVMLCVVIRFPYLLCVFKCIEFRLWRRFFCVLFLLYRFGFFIARVVR